MNKKIIVANWKMNPASPKEAESLLKAILKSVKLGPKVDVVICAPFLFLERLSKITKKISFGAQDAFWEEQGSFTGEISAKMLSNMGIKYVLLGHSERRALGETNQDVSKKIKASLSAGLVPVVCIGEKERDENSEYLNFVKNQVVECLNTVPKNLIEKVIVVYEPVWAIGKNAVRETNPAEFREMSIFIKKILSDKFGANNIKKLRILYGGSVHPENAGGFLAEGADGLLPGRDSLDPKKFAEIVKVAKDAL